jgi:hypothetical protein
MHFGQVGSQWIAQRIIDSMPTIDRSSSQSAEVANYAKQKVIRIVRSIKALSQLHKKMKDKMMPMLVFIDMIRDQEYDHVSLCLLEQFI